MTMNEIQTLVTIFAQLVLILAAGGIMAYVLFRLMVYPMAKLGWKGVKAGWRGSRTMERGVRRLVMASLGGVGNAARWAAGIPGRTRTWYAIRRARPISHEDLRQELARITNCTRVMEAYRQVPNVHIQGSDRGGPAIVWNHPDLGWLRCDLRPDVNKPHSAKIGKTRAALERLWAEVDLGDAPAAHPARPPRPRLAPGQPLRAMPWAWTSNSSGIALVPAPTPTPPPSSQWLSGCSGGGAGLADSGTNAVGGAGGAGGGGCVVLVAYDGEIGAGTVDVDDWAPGDVVEITPGCLFRLDDDLHLVSARGVRCEHISEHISERPASTWKRIRRAGEFRVGDVVRNLSGCSPNTTATLLRQDDDGDWHYRYESGRHDYDLANRLELVRPAPEGTEQETSEPKPVWEVGDVVRGGVTGSLYRVTSGPRGFGRCQSHRVKLIEAVAGGCGTELWCDHAPPHTLVRKHNDLRKGDVVRVTGPRGGDYGSRGVGVEVRLGIGGGIGGWSAKVVKACGSYYRIGDAFDIPIGTPVEFVSLGSEEPAPAGVSA